MRQIGATPVLQVSTQQWQLPAALDLHVETAVLQLLVSFCSTEGSSNLCHRCSVLVLLLATSDWKPSQHAGAVNYPMPGYPGKYVSKQFWGELQLVSGARVHARIFGSFSSILLEDLLTELGPLTERDVIITNFGAWYPGFVKQVGGGLN